MPSDPGRVHAVMWHIRRIKAGDYPAIVGRDGLYRVVERPFAELAEPAKLAILQDAVDWSGVTNRDRAHVLLSEIDPGRITDAQRSRLIEMATAEDWAQKLDRQAARGAGARAKDRDRGVER